VADLVAAVVDVDWADPSWAVPVLGVVEAIGLALIDSPLAGCTAQTDPTRAGRKHR
jgi:hypothetical protein